LTSITITLPGEPRGKGRTIGRMHNVLPAKTKAYQDALAWAGKAEMAGKPLFDGPLAVVVLAAMAIPPSWSKKKQQAAIRGEIYPTGVPDLDNIMKCLDAFNGVVWRDDATVVNATISKRYSVDPCLLITVTAL